MYLMRNVTENEGSVLVTRPQVALQCFIVKKYERTSFKKSP